MKHCQLYFIGAAFLFAHLMHASEAAQLAATIKKIQQEFDKELNKNYRIKLPRDVKNSDTLVVGTEHNKQKMMAIGSLRTGKLYLRGKDADGSYQWRIILFNNPICALAFNHQGDRLAVATQKYAQQSIIHLVDLTMDSCILASRTMPALPVEKLSFSANDRYLACLFKSSYENYGRVLQAKNLDVLKNDCDLKAEDIVWLPSKAELVLINEKTVKIREVKHKRIAQ